jgi:hypothetical protein
LVWRKIYQGPFDVCVYIYIINISVRINLCTPQLILRVLKMMTIWAFSDHYVSNYSVWTWNHRKNKLIDMKLLSLDRWPTKWLYFMCIFSFCSTWIDVLKRNKNSTILLINMRNYVCEEVKELKNITDNERGRLFHHFHLLP